MARQCRRETVLCLLGMLASPGIAAADPHPMTAGTNPRPTTSAQVAIAREELVINIKPNVAEVRAALWLHNRDPEATLQTGFPCDIDPEEHVSTLPCTTALQVSLDGRPVAPKKRATSKTVANWIWPLRLAADGRARLDISYRAPLVNERYGTGPWGMEALVYRLVTGAAWAGPIRELEIEVRTPAEGLAFIAPAGYWRSPGRIRWSLVNFEPKEDLLLLYAGDSGFSYLGEPRSEGDTISVIERALELMQREPKRLAGYHNPLAFFGSQWQADLAAYQRGIDESASLLERRLPLRWRILKTQMKAAGKQLPLSVLRIAYSKEPGFLSTEEMQAMDPAALANEMDRRARTWLDFMEDDSSAGVHVAAAKAALGDDHGAIQLRDSVADGPPLVVARGLAALHIPVCPLIEGRLPEEWATHITKTQPASIEPDTFALARELDQRETRLRLLQLMSEGTEGACLAFVTEEANGKDASPEERALAKAILRRGTPPKIPEPTLATLARELRNPVERKRLLALKMLAQRADEPALRLRAGLGSSRFCESRLLAGATFDQAEKAPRYEGCLPEHHPALYSILLAAGNYARAAEMLRKLGGNDITFIGHLREWLETRQAPAAALH